MLQSVIFFSSTSKALTDQIDEFLAIKNGYRITSLNYQIASSLHGNILYTVLIIYSAPDKHEKSKIITPN